ncbi:MAG: hypothetical protein AAGF11_40825 [Myxococcota bacterium]
MGAELVDLILSPDGWRTAPVEPRLAATLMYLDRLTREPESVTEAFIDEVIAAGATPSGLESASLVCLVFSVINRLVDAFGADLSPVEAQTLGAVLDKGGSAVARLRGRPKPWVRYGGTIPAPLTTCLQEVRQGKGDAPPPIRAAIEARVARQAGTIRPEPPALPEEVTDLVDTIAADAHGVTDAHIDRLKAAGWSEPAVYEFVFVASFAAGLGRLERAIRLLAAR